MSALHREVRGRFRWLDTVEDDGPGRTIRTTRTALSTGVVVEWVRAPSGAVAVSICDLSGCEIALSSKQSAELRAALGELPQ